MSHVIYVYLLAFTVCTIVLYIVLQKFTSRPMAFAYAVAASIALIWGLYGIQEGAVFDMNFQNMFVTGEFQMLADARPQDATRFRLQPGVNFQSGRVSGTLIQAL